LTNSNIFAAASAGVVEAVSILNVGLFGGRRQDISPEFILRPSKELRMTLRHSLLRARKFYLTISGCPASLEIKAAMDQQYGVISSSPSERRCSGNFGLNCHSLKKRSKLEQAEI
jgi:hypothetical protein